MWHIIFWQILSTTTQQSSIIFLSYFQMVLNLLRIQSYIDRNMKLSYQDYFTKIFYHIIIIINKQVEYRYSINASSSINNFYYKNKISMRSNLSLYRQASNVYSQAEQINPENVFSKLMSIPDDIPIRQCKMLLDTMRQQILFEKNIIQNTYRQLIPNHVKLERIKSQSFRNYQKLLTYTKKKRDLQQIQRRTVGKVKVKVKRNKAQSLIEFINDTKIRMLTENSKYRHDDRIVQSILSDDKQRQKLFDESILIQRLHYVKRQQLKCAQQSSKIPAKFKGLDPRHLRIPESCRQETSFHRRKYIHHQKTFQYFKNAIKTQKNLLKTKQKQNGLVINHLMNNFSQQILNNQNSNANSTQKCIYRLFLKYANSDSEDIGNMFKYISGERIIKFFQDFNIEYKNNKKLLEIIDNHQINELYFLQILHQLGRKQGNKFQSNIKAFLEAKILTNPKLYLPKQWNLYQQHKIFIEKHMRIRRFKQKLQFLHQNLLKKQRSQLLGYNFDQMVQIMWILKIYPFMISKKRLRFFYLYTQSSQVGITIDDIADIYMYVALSMEGEAVQNVNLIVNIVADYSQSKKQE